MCTSQQEVKVWYSVAFHENSTQLAIRSVDKYIMCPPRAALGSGENQSLLLIGSWKFFLIVDNIMTPHKDVSVWIYKLTFGYKTKWSKLLRSGLPHS